MKNFILLLFAAGFCLISPAQDRGPLQLSIINQEKEPVAFASVEILKQDSSLLRIASADDKGFCSLSLPASAHFFRISRSGYAPAIAKVEVSLPAQTIILQQPAAVLGNVSVTARKPLVEFKPGKTVVNLDASISNVGTNILEALEKMPGITVDKDGNISLKGKPGVTVMIDGKPTYLDPAQLASLLQGMNSSQVNQVEIMENPPARYDAAGNAGVINIRLKKNLQRGFNGSISATYGQGFYDKNNHNLQLNLRSGKWNVFANYSTNFSGYFTRIYALRRYFENDGSINRQLEQHSFLKGRQKIHNLRTGFDLSITNKTSVGAGISAILLERKGEGNSLASWMNASGGKDSVIRTISNTLADWKNAGLNFNFRHSFSSGREWTADVDLIGYRIDNFQDFNNYLQQPGYYRESTRAEIPSEINILSAKTDYTHQLKNTKLETGLKTSRITTDNLAEYELFNNSNWEPDLGKSNHFLYEEFIHAIYGSAETKIKKWSLQGGLRYEMTNYKANQLGNAVVKDSSFSRNYNSLFPTVMASVELDSSNQFSFSAGRRIDRPAFQKLNPFLFIINKYTYQVGNPYYRPQFTWNFELNHMYKQLLVTGISYSTTNDYFSQVFPVDSNGIVLYTEGNLGRLQNFGLSAGLQIAPAKWWSLNTQAVLNHKKMQGVIDRPYTAKITQLHLNINNQFRFGKGWSAELSGFYTSKSQHDIQEIVDPAGQVSAGIGKTVLQNKGTIRLAARDLFYTQWMKGNTLFTNADEYFKLTRDTRVATVSFVYRFGKAFKSVRRSQGAAREEIERVGNG